MDTFGYVICQPPIVAAAVDTVGKLYVTLIYIPNVGIPASILVTQATLPWLMGTTNTLACLTQQIPGQNTHVHR